MAAETPSSPKYWISKDCEYVQAPCVPAFLAELQRPIPPPGAEDRKAAARRHAEFLHQRELQALIDSGELTLRDGISRHPVPPCRLGLQHVLSIDDVIRFCARAGVTLGRGAWSSDQTGRGAAQKVSARVWTDSEKAEMRRDRAKGMTDEAIGLKWGFKRQRVGALIGSKIANKASRKA